MRFCSSDLLIPGSAFYSSSLELVQKIGHYV